MRRAAFRLSYDGLRATENKDPGLGQGYRTAGLLSGSGFSAGLAWGPQGVAIPGKPQAFKGRID